MKKYMFVAVAVAVAVSGGGVVAVAVPVAGLTNVESHPQRFLNQCLGLGSVSRPAQPGQSSKSMWFSISAWSRVLPSASRGT